MQQSNQAFTGNHPPYSARQNAPHRKSHYDPSRPTRADLGGGSLRSILAREFWAAVQLAIAAVLITGAFVLFLLLVAFQRPSGGH